MFLLDTNVISELRRPDRANADVLKWSGDHDGRQFFISAATVRELQYGALILGYRDPKAGEVFQRWIDGSVLPDFSDRILPMTTGIALVCARFHVPHRRGDRDAWIAATALVHDLTVVTRNVRDFQHDGLKIFNPWMDG